MAIVANLADDGGPIPNYTNATDRKYCTHSRSNAGTPNGSLTPAFLGELVLDTTSMTRWKAVGAANTDWVPFDDYEVPAS